MSYFLKWWLAPILSVGVLGAGFYYFNYKSPAGDVSSAGFERNDYEELNEPRAQSEGLQSSPEEELKTNDESSETASADSQQKRGLASTREKIAICIEMYGPSRRYWAEVEDCKGGVRMSVLNDMYQMFRFLKRPATNLSKIDPRIFDAYLDISIDSFKYKLVYNWSRTETEEVLYWLLYNEDILDILEKRDPGYKIFTAMLSKLANFNPSAGYSIYRPFVSKVKNRRLMEIAIQSNKEEVIEWLMDYINDNGACRIDEDSKACFKVYCKIGKGIRYRVMKQWMAFDEFEGYIEDIVDNKINSEQGTRSNQGTGWKYGDGDNQFKDVGDVSDDWVKDLCGGLI